MILHLRNHNSVLCPWKSMMLSFQIVPRSGLLCVDVPFREEAAWDGIPWEGRDNKRPDLQVSVATLRRKPDFICYRERGEAFDSVGRASSQQITSVTTTFEIKKCCIIILFTLKQF